MSRIQAPGPSSPVGPASGTLASNYPNPSLAPLSPSPAGTYGSSSQIPVVTVNAAGQVTAVTQDGVAAAGSVPAIVFSPVDLFPVQGGGGQIYGPYTVGCSFYVYNLDCQIKGVRFWWAGNTTDTIKVCLWNGYDGTLVTSATGTATVSPGANTILFSSPAGPLPIQTSGNVISYVVTIYDTNGNDVFAIGTSFPSPTPTWGGSDGFAVAYAGPYVNWISFVLASSSYADTFPNTNLGHGFCVEPVFV